MLDEDQEAKLKREFAREYQLITREDRLEKIAEDLVAHYMGRGVLAKAMMIAIDRAAIYGTAQGGAGSGETPIKDKAELARRLSEAIDAATIFCGGIGVDPAKIRDAQGFERERLKDDAVAAILVNDETRRRYVMLARNVDKLFKSLLPDAAANDFGPIRKVFRTGWC